MSAEHGWGRAAGLVALGQDPDVPGSRWRLERDVRAERPGGAGCWNSVIGPAALTIVRHRKGKRRRFAASLPYGESRTRLGDTTICRVANDL
jgi:hypothetical protein